MSTRVRTIALVLMAKEPVAGFVKTRLVPPLDPGGARALAEAMLLDSIARLASFGDCDRWIAYAPEAARAYFERVTFSELSIMPQSGGDLGCRMRAIVEARAGVDRGGVIVIGSDLPTLPAAYVQSAVESLRDGSNLVLGPTEDGGYYLIGLARPASGLFEAIAWSTPRVLEQTLERARSTGLEPDLLPSWYDVDDLVGLARLRADLARTPSEDLPLHTARLLETL